MKQDIFCKIAKGNTASAKIWEDKDFVAILDAYPNTKGMALVITKKHYNSYPFDMDDKHYIKLMLASKKVAKILEKGLKVKRVAMVLEGMGINHAHIKLYPLHGLKDKFKTVSSNQTKYYNNYQGQISTHLGPKADIDELKVLAVKIKKANKK